MGLPCACISSTVVAIVIVPVISRPHSVSRIFMHASAAYRATNSCSDDHKHKESGDEKESPELHAKDDHWRAIIVEDFAGLWWFVIPLVVDDGVFVGVCGADGLVVFETVGGSDFWCVVILIQGG